jgi:hypothetical protein
VFTGNINLQGSVAQESLFAWYTFSANSRLEDSSFHNNHLSDSQSPVAYQSDCQWKGAECAVFGSNSLQNYYSLPNMDLGFWSAREGFSICMWFLFDDFDRIRSFSRIFDLGLGPGNKNVLLARYGNGDTLSLIYNYDGPIQQIDSPIPITFGTWRHFCVTNQNTGAGKSLWTFYENGILSLQTTLDPVLPQISLTSNFIGKSNWDDPTFKGKMDDFRIYSKALSAEEIELLYGYQGQYLLIVY